MYTAEEKRGEDNTLRRDEQHEKENDAQDYDHGFHLLVMRDGQEHSPDQQVHHRN